MNEPRTFRQQVIDKFIAAFGQPQVARIEPGNLYRWTLRRDGHGKTMFITIDSPEYPEMAHVLISDSAANQAEPLVAVGIRTLPDAELLIERLMGQWKAIG